MIMSLSPIFEKEDQQNVITNNHEELVAFHQVYEDIKSELTEFGRSIGQTSPALQELSEWMTKALDYNVPHGKKSRGLTVVASFRHFATPDLITPDNLHLARMLGWCMELFQAFALIMDDIMDQSETRRGKQCWYRVDGVGLTAVNDGLLMESLVYQLLEKHFSHKPYINQVYRLFHRITLLTCYGQAVDLLSTPTGRRPDLTKFTNTRYETIVTYKTGYYTFVLPVRLGMYMAEITDSTAHDQIESILLKMGQFFQVQDDYLDCYGHPQVTGKIGTDIQDGKCSWLIVKALSLANEKQVEMLKEHYGGHEANSIEIVKSIYDELSIEEHYLDYEKKWYADIVAEIDETSQRLRLPSALLHGLAAKIYKRTK